MSSTAIPYWYYAIAVIATIMWGISPFVPQSRRWAPGAVAAVWAVAAVIESPWHITPRLTPANSRTLVVIGDSVSAGLGDNETDTWPNILARTHNIEVRDISHAGETAASALKRAEAEDIDAPVVILEIGGNDLLGSTSSVQFGRDLDALLAHVASPGRQLIMFELPLPPFCHEYGRIQRTLARKHEVALVPKRVFLSILAAGGSTVDSIHLSKAGHQRMAERVWQLVIDAYPARPDHSGERGT